ncbi:MULTISPECIES: J domain-containing protein [unclassified Treponema]|uniref:J domain-containing protein n=1 Tax=unclassified Treponema TaxID=2638727 RepID=UPI0020A45975|nr:MULTISPECIES: J domain-containing protein [unclassified Treponema]UTC66226.1 J domain-containing protein [Treponema sp. OMZ 789]UTC68955.1 J domain-containing protein [Treponema sp. OMZ 790]UTC71682.1 J domain-containing protein [Treponema sp. OMZ 791]
MSKNYYNDMGNILRDALTSDEDPFAAASEKSSGRYRTIGGRMERRPPPKINKETVRVAVPPELVEDFAVLNVLPGVPVDECKKSWKRLIKKYHPDFQSSSAKQVEANVIIRRINNSYRKIETWFKTGKILSEKDLNS